AEQVVNNLLRLTQPENTDKLVSAIEHYNRLAVNADRTVLRIDSIIRINQENINNTLASARVITSTLEESSERFSYAVDKAAGITGNDAIRIIIGTAQGASDAPRAAALQSVATALCARRATGKSLLARTGRA